jgi:preprotein translocase subunit SecE
VSKLAKIFIGLGVAGVIFAILWWRGYLVRISTYVQETREELRKCSWPTWDELKGSTVLIVISIVLLGVFTYAVDQIFFLLVFKVLKA